MADIFPFPPCGWKNYFRELVAKQPLTAAQRRQLRRIEHWYQHAAADLGRLGGSGADQAALERIAERLREHVLHLERSQP